MKYETQNSSVMLSLANYSTQVPISWENKEYVVGTFRIL